jgi:glycosyltransferase involved in cell wall biosynthesis
MRPVFIIRMPSGLIDSVKKSDWRPYGIPAIYKLIEGLNQKNIALDILFLCKTERESNNIKGIKKVKFNNLKANFYIFQYHHLRVSSSRARKFYNDCLQFGKVFFKFFLKKKYDLIYIDRTNIVLAAFSSLFVRAKIVIRFLGIANFKHFTDKMTYILSSPLVYLSLKVPYSLVICSEDGSPSRNLFTKCLNKRTPYKILLNGVDEKAVSKDTEVSIRSRYNFDAKIPIFLFVGKLTPDKGPREFIDVLLRLKDKGKKFYTIFICGGGDFRVLYEEVCSGGLGDQVVFERFVEHSKMLSYYQQSDVYISLNKFGNLSNAVLEAMAAAKCIIMLGKEDKTGVDESTERFVPDDVVIRIDRNNIVKDLTKKLADLIDNPEKISIYSKYMRSFAKEFLWSWDERINYEIELLEKVAKGELIE